MRKFPFRDLHGYKDYVVFAQACLPDKFPVRDGKPTEDQWTLDLAFEGLRHGLELAVKEKGELPVLPRCRELVEKAYAHYRAGRKREVFFTLSEMEKLLKTIPSQ